MRYSSNIKQKGGGWAGREGSRNLQGREEMKVEGGGRRREENRRNVGRGGKAEEAQGEGGGGR